MKRIESFEAVGIDFDGTIADTRKAMTTSRLEAFASMGEELDDERYTQIDQRIHAEAHHHGTKPLEIIGWVMIQAGIITDIGHEESAVQAVVDRRNQIYWDKARHGFDALPGAVQTIQVLCGLFGDKASIVTTAPLDEEVLPFLSRYGLDDLFSQNNLITRTDVVNHKPDPEAYLMAIKQSEVDPQRYLVLEDARLGILAGRRAGAFVAALETTHSADELLQLPLEEQPNMITSTHQDFQRIFL